MCFAKKRFKAKLYLQININSRNSSFLFYFQYINDKLGNNLYGKLFLFKQYKIFLVELSIILNFYATIWYKVELEIANNNQVYISFWRLYYKNNLKTLVEHC